MHIQRIDHPVRRQITNTGGPPHPTGDGRNPFAGSSPTPSPTASVSTSKSGSSTSILSIVVVVVLIFLITALTASYTLLRRFRLQNREPKYIPTSYLKRKWHAWSPWSKYGQISSGRNRERSENSSYNPAGHEIGDRSAAAAAADRVDRHASIRSVMTLPPYSQAPKETEQVIGREGERAGMDTVVEFPETAEESEAQREEQMESLYQIRLARRQEIAQREERRQARREARARGDYATLEQLRRESQARAASNNPSNVSLAASANGANSVTAATLLAEHQSRSARDRRVSEVTYASVGHVRHDGTRLRANSDDSERGALLESAASMGESRGRGYSDAPSVNSNLSQPHFRDRSMSSALSVSTTASDLENQPQGDPMRPSTQRDGSRTRGSRDSDPATSGTSNSSPLAQRFTPEESTGSDDIGEIRILESIDSPQPPNYEHLDWGDAPAYEAEVRRRESVRQQEALNRASIASNRQSVGGLTRVPSQAPQLSVHLSPLPSIHVEGATEPNTPITPSNPEDIHMTQR